MEQYEHALSFLGCNTHEIDTFMHLLKFPEGVSVVELSRISHNTRPTLYGHLNSLLKKGLAKKYTREKTSLFAAQSKSILMEMYDEKLALHTQNRNALEDLVAVENVSENIPRFSLHEGPQSFDPIFMDMLRSGAKEVCWIWPIQIMIDFVSPSHFEYFHQQRLARGIHMKVLWSEESRVDLNAHPFLLPETNSMRDIRILPKDIEPVVGYGIYDTKVAVISNKNESFGFIVESQDFAQTIQNTFDYLWKQSKKY